VLVVVHVDVERGIFGVVDAIASAVTQGDNVLLLVAGHEDAEREAGEGTAVATLVQDIRSRGIQAEARLTEPDVLDSVADVLEGLAPDRIVVITPPLGLADHLRLDLAHRVSTSFGLPTTHVVVDGATWSGGIDLSIGAGLDATRERPNPAVDPGPPLRLPSWFSTAAAIAIVVLVVALAATIGWGLRRTSVDKRHLLVRETAAPTTLVVVAGTPDPVGPTREYPAFFPSATRVHAGDAITFTNQTPDVPHTVTFGVAPDHSNQPVFGSHGGGPIPVVVAPCASSQALTTSSFACDSTSASTPGFDGQAYYNSGIIGGQQSFTLPISPRLRPGTYHYYCLIHPDQRGTIIVEPHGVPTQLQATVDAAARQEEQRATNTIAALQPPQALPDGVVQAGVTGPSASLNQFFPSGIHINAGQTVTWQDRSGTPHVMLFDEYLDAATATFSPPTGPSGSSYAGGPFNTGPIGDLPYPSTTFALRFTRPGTYTYVCSFHPGMGGTVVVDP